MVAQTPPDAATSEGISDRLLAQRARLGKSQQEMADFTGIPFSTYVKYELGTRAPGSDALAQLARAGLDVVHLLIGEGNTQLRTQEHRAPYGPPGGTREGYVYLPLYDVRASAGNGSLAESENAVDVLAFKEEWVRRELRARPEDLNLIYVEGDSMEPDLRAGDIVLLDHTDKHARREGVYVIRMDGALLVKQLQRLPGGVVKVISRNAVYEPFTVTVQQIEDPNGFAVIGRVVWACRRF